LAGERVQGPGPAQESGSRVYDQSSTCTHAHMEIRVRTYPLMETGCGMVAGLGRAWWRGPPCMYVCACTRAARIEWCDEPGWPWRGGRHGGAPPLCMHVVGCSRRRCTAVAIPSSGLGVRLPRFFVLNSFSRFFFFLASFFFSILFSRFFFLASFFSLLFPRFQRGLGLFLERQHRRR